MAAPSGAKPDAPGPRTCWQGLADQRIPLLVGDLPLDRGTDLRTGRIDDERQAAADLACFVAELRRNDLPPIDDETPYGGRPPLAEQDAATRNWIAQSGDLIDGPAVTAAWDDALKGPAWDGTYAWIHSDLAPPNLLVKDGRLRASSTSAPPASVTPPTTSTPRGASSVRKAAESSGDLVSADDDTWRRGRGITISQAVGLVPYYVVTNPALSALGQRMLREVLADINHVDTHG